MPACLLLVLLAVLLTGCETASEAQPPAATSAWGTVLTLGQAPQTQAPSIWVDNETAAASWVTVTEEDYSFGVRHLTDGQWGEGTVLTVPLNTPHALQTAEGQSNGTHLLWLDTVEGEARLLGAYLRADNQVERALVPISDRRTDHYTLIRSPDSSLWVVWSGGLPAQPQLFAQSIDALGRPRPPLPLTPGEYPVLIDGEQPYLYWIYLGQIMRATFDAGVLGEAEIVTPAPHRPEGAQLASYYAGRDNTHVYLFWNFVLADGSPQTWMTSGALTEGNWSLPTRLDISIQLGTSFDTGYNGGTGLRAAAGEIGVSWAAPANSEAGVLPVAVQTEGELGVLYFRAGQPVGYQAVIELGEQLLSPPRLHIDGNRHLYLTWSQPGTLQAADLLLTTTRPLN